MPRLTPEQVEKAHWTPVKPGEAIVPLPGTMEVTPSPWVVFTVQQSVGNPAMMVGARMALPLGQIAYIVEGEVTEVAALSGAVVYVNESFDELLGLPPARTEEE